jgi:hydroxymethylbilane synthase
VARIVLGTRGSALALWQARHVAQRLRERHPNLAIEERIIRTEGDIQQQAPLGVSDVGVFVRRIEEALLAGKVDLAVHSLKDLPTTQPEGLRITAVPERHDPRDVLLSDEGWTLERLPRGARLGTGSFRRRTQLLHARPDLEVLPVRGNVDTRIRKLRSGEFDAMVLALAGVQRLGISEVALEPIDTDICLPAVGQGALALETRETDQATSGLVQVLDHAPSHNEVEAERAFLRRLGGGCLAPATGFARVQDGGLQLRAAVGDPDGKTLLRDEESGSVADASAIGERLAQRMLDAGAGELLQQARQDEDHA